MPNICGRIERLTDGKFVEGRDPQLIEFLRGLSETFGKPSDISMVPVGVPAKAFIGGFYDSVANKPCTLQN